MCSPPLTIEVSIRNYFLTLPSHPWSTFRSYPDSCGPRFVSSPSSVLTAAIAWLPCHRPWSPRCYHLSAGGLCCICRPVQYSPTVSCPLRGLCAMYTSAVLPYHVTSHLRLSFPM